MLSFSPSSLKNQIIDSLKTLKFFDGDIDDIEFERILTIDESEYDDITIDENSSVCLYIGEEHPYITVKQFLYLAQVKDTLFINQNQSYAKSNNEIYFLLDAIDYDTCEVLYNTFKGDSRRVFHPDVIKAKSILAKESIVNGKTYTCSLFNGFCFYHMMVFLSGNYDKYTPAYSPDDYFIKISCNNDLDMGEADSLAAAYVFELQSSFNLLLPFSSGRMDPMYSNRSDESLLGKESELFPLIYGTGATELLTLYNTAKTTYDLDFKILGYTKVIEYIAPTISQQTLIDNITLKLSSLNVFKPTAKYISELGLIYEKYKNTSNKDSELIRLSITTVVSLDEVWDSVPGFIKGKQQSLPDEKEQIVFLEKISDSVYNTRNEIAHAKANYEKKGTECPKKYKSDFCDMLELIAIRCIRWFALQPEDKRVVLH